MLAVIIPLVLLLVYAGYKILQKRKAENEEDDNADLVYQENLRYAFPLTFHYCVQNVVFLDFFREKLVKT